MAHYAILDNKNIVTKVIVGKDETDTSMNWEEYYGGMRTSYNTYGGVHRLGGVPFRKNYAGVGYKYDYRRDAFIPPKPETGNWVLNEETCLWEEE